MRGLALAIVLAAAASHAETFQHQRAIAPGGTGPNRLDVDAALLSGCAPGFPDLRLYDQASREVPYLKIEPTARERQWTRSTLLDVVSTKTTSGFEADIGSLRRVDRLRLNGIAAPYLKHVTLEGGGDRAHWTLLADTTVFDLPDQNLRRPEIAFAAGAYRYLRVSWDDRTSARVSRPQSVEARLDDGVGPSGPLRSPLSVTKLSSEPGKSRYRLDLPGPHLPIEAVEVSSSGGDMFRNATVTEPQLANGAIAPVTLGGALLRRAVRSGFVAAETSIPITAPTGRELELIVDDGSNSPLPGVSAVARFAAQPWIYLEVRATEPLTARYGNEHLAAPRYDLEAARPSIRRAVVAVAHWSGAPQSVPPSAFEATPMPEFGPAVDRGSFRVGRALQGGERGLVVLPLDADVLSISRSLADVRIIDGKNRQVPYVVEHRDEPLTMPLQVPARQESSPGVSRFHVPLPYATLPAGTRLVLKTSASVFDRTVHVMRSADERRGRDEIEIASAQWRNSTPDAVPPSLTFDTPLSATTAIDIAVDEGDNAPLPIVSIELLLPAYALRFHHPGGALAIVYGNDQASTPRYDLALIAPRLLTEPARTISIAKPVTTTEEALHPEKKYFWIIIAVAAIVLLALLARVIASASKEPAET